MKTYNRFILTLLCSLFTGLSLSAQPIAPYDILINEFMADPIPPIGSKTDLPKFEFIELFNRSKTKTFNLKRFKIVNGSVSSPLLRDIGLKPTVPYYFSK